MFHNSPMLTSDSDDNHSTLEEYSINFKKKTTQDFGLGYWINHNNSCPKPPLPFHKSDKPVYSTKSTNRIKSNETCLSSSYQKPKRSKKTKHISKCSSNNDNLQLKSTEIKYSNNDIPRLKIPKHIITNYFKSRSPNYTSDSSSSSSSEISPYSSRNDINVKNAKLISKRSHNVSNSSSVTKDSSCLEKSLDKSVSWESKSQILVASRDRMSITLTIDQTVYSEFLHNKPCKEVSIFSKLDDALLHKDKVKNPKRNEKIRSEDCIGFIPKGSTDIHILPLVSKHDSLSLGCDISPDKSMTELDFGIVESRKDSSSGDQKSSTQCINGRKRSLDSLSDIDNDGVVSTKKKLIESRAENEMGPKKIFEERNVPEITPIAFVKFLIDRLKNYELFIYEKYCLSQPHAMKFLAQNHATNWESNKNDINQMHLVPCEFLNEILHRALHCFGLEKKILKETAADDSSPMNSCNFSHSSEYKKIRDEYSFSLKRVRYGIGVIDELFRQKANYQNIAQNNDVPIVRKWKHIIYYLCLHAKSAFMAKEIQYHNYVQFTSNSFENTIDLCTNNTPSIRCSSTITQEPYNKPQLTFPLPRDSLKILENTLNLSCLQKITPEHFSQSDFEISPHSYDSGKGSSVRTSSNTNSLVSGCHTTSSLNSTPHSIQDTQPNLPGFQLYRIDEYQITANEYIRLLPEALQLHNRIVSKIGAEPNANSRDNMIKLIHYIDICQEMCKGDLMNECLQRLLSQAVRL